jgi:anti-sigma regulatory factor (Ser/Thr protein kinase)
VTFPARRVHAAVFRCICESLATQAGFTGRDVFMIKLAADEVFTNAVTHGSEAYGVSRIYSDIVLDNEGMTVTVRDEAGRPFNYHTFQSRRGEERPGAVKSGLDLVDRVMDSWAVRTEHGKYTEVTFRKRRASGSASTQSPLVCSC